MLRAVRLSTLRPVQARLFSSSALRHKVKYRRTSVISFSLQNVGFIGLGNMGGHMATNLAKNGHSLVVFDVNSETAQRIVAAAKAKGVAAKVAMTPKAVAEECDTVITMLPSSPHVREVYLGADGVLAGARAGALLIDSSTIDPGTARAVAAAVAAGPGKPRMLDAPVSGGVAGAEAGTLTFMVGGPEKDFAEAKAVLQHMGRNLVHCGDSGTGQVAKVCNNLILGISMVGVSEGMNLGVKLGMDPKKLAAIVNTSSGRCWASDSNNPVPGVMENAPASRGYNGGFGVDLMKKDLGLALDAAASIDAPLPLGKETHALYEAMSKQLHAQNAGPKDFGFAYKFLSEQPASK